MTIKIYKPAKTAMQSGNRNTKKWLAEYISDIDNPKWKQIATLGREYAMKTFNNDKGVKSLIEFFKEFM